MGCGCGGAKKRERYTVVLPGGTRITKASKSDAEAFASKHPGSRVIKPA